MANWIFDDEEENKIDTPEEVSASVEPIKSSVDLESEMREARELDAPIPEDKTSAELAGEMLSEMGPIPDAAPKANKYQEILEAYRSLKPKQEQYQDQLRNIGMLQGANQIAQGFARGYGVDIGAGEAGIKSLQQQAEEPLTAVKRQMSTGKEAIGLEDDISMADPDSDVSKFYREQAYAVLKKLRPESDYEGKLEGMSASQLQKLPGMKNLGATLGQQSPWIATDRVDEEGNPIRFNKMTGEYSLADGRLIKPGSYTTRDITKKNALGLYERQSDLIRNAGSSPKGMESVPDSSGKMVPKEAEYKDIFKNAPDVAKEFNKIRDNFTKDMKESREVATSVTNLASKLKPGPNGEVDSGLLGGIQTQAAKMAGQKGVLTDQDLVKFAGAGGVVPKIERIIDGSIFGDMTDSDIKFFKRFAQLMGKSLDQDIMNRSQLYVEQGRQLADTAVPGITSSNVSKILGVDKVAPVVQDIKKSNKPKPGTIVNIKGKQYQVGEDGDSLTPINK